MKRLVLILFLLCGSASASDLIGYYTGTHNVDNYMNSVGRCFPLEPAQITSNFVIDSFSLLAYDVDRSDSWARCGLYTDQGGPFGPASLVAVSDSFTYPGGPSADQWGPPTPLTYTLTASTQYWFAFMAWSEDGVVDTDIENVVASAGGYRDSCYQYINITLATRTFAATAVVTGASDGIMNVKVWGTFAGAGAASQVIMIGATEIGRWKTKWWAIPTAHGVWSWSDC